MLYLVTQSAMSVSSAASKIHSSVFMQASLVSWSKNVNFERGRERKERREREKEIEREEERERNKETDN